MDLDRQAIERRDFPIARRGYEPAAVDAHLRGLAAEFEELQRTAGSGGSELSLATTAGSQVQSILAAAETAAAEIERQAMEAARETREGADRDAHQTREEAIAKARGHAEAVSQAAAMLLERVGSMDGEVRALVESLRSGAGRLSTDLSALETNMGELYDAASGRGGSAVAAPSGPAHPTPVSLERSGSGGAIAAEPSAQADAPAASPDAPAASPAAPAASHHALEAASPAPAPAGGTDLDGARLVALNMALNGEPRAETERYLAENFELADRDKLIDEVYAAIDG